MSDSCRGEVNRALATQREGGGVRVVAGCGPSLAEMLQVVAIMKDYAGMQDADAEIVSGVDKAFEGFTRDVSEHHWGRRYLPSTRSRERVLEWTARAQADFEASSSGMSEEEQNRALRWCSSEVVGVKGYRRAMQHPTHEDTNYLFGLYTAVLRYLFPGEFEIETVVLMEDLLPEHADFCEVLGSMLVGSYAMDTGLNPVLAGGADWSKGPQAINRAELDPLWAAVQSRFEKKTVWHKKARIEDAKESLREEEVRNTESAYGRAEVVVSRKRSLEEAEAELADLSKSRRGFDDIDEFFDRT